MPIKRIRRLPQSTLGIAVVSGIFLLLFGFGSTPGSANLVAHPWDKLLHLFIFTILTVGLRLSLPRIPVSLIIGIALSVALADELHQFFVPLRQPSWDDGIADAIGVLCGLTLWWQYKRTWLAQRTCDEV